MPVQDNYWVEDSDSYETLADFDAGHDMMPQLDSTKSPLLLYKGPESIVKGPEEAMDPDFKNLLDGRIYFATDTKKIYLDCDFTGSDGVLYRDRLSFGGNNGIFFGRRSKEYGRAFTKDEEDNGNYWFIVEFNDLEDNRDDLPAVDDLILNSDGCFYRVSLIHQDHIDETVIDDQGNSSTVPSEEVYTIVETKKLTLQGTGGGGGGSSATSTVIAVKDPDQKTTIVKSLGTIPIGFKVTDSMPDATIDIDIYIDGTNVGTRTVRASNEYQTIDLQRYVSYISTNIGHTIMLRFTDEYNSSAAFTIRNFQLIELKVEMETNLGQKTTTNFPIRFYPYGGTSMHDWVVKVRLQPPGEGNAILDTLTGLTADRGAEASYTVNIQGYSEGAYTIQMWIEAHAEEDSELLTSAVATASFYYADEHSTTPGVNMVLAAGSSLTQYSYAIIEYTVIYSNSTKTTVHLQAICDGTVMADTYSEVTNGINQQWMVNLGRSGIYQFKIILEDYNVTQTIDNVEVSGIDATVPTINRDDAALQLYLSAAGKSNASLDRETWVWNDIECQFSGFNWTSNGWITDENMQTSLHMTNGAKLIVPFAPFAYSNTAGTGAQGTGKTIELDFKVSNVRDPNAILIEAASWVDKQNGEIFTGIIGQGEKICLNGSDIINYHLPAVEAAMTDAEVAATNGLRAYITDNERVHISFVIQSKNEPNSKRMIYVYVNGVVSGLIQYGDQTTFMDRSLESPSYFVFDSTNGDIDLYGIRVYSKKFTDDEILYNYSADQATIDDKLAMQANNDVLDNNGNVSLVRVAQLANIPYIVWTDCRPTTSKKGGYDKKDQSTWTAQITGNNPSLPTGKKDFRWCEFYYVDPQHPDRNIGDVNNKVTGVIYAQGTSSLDYPVKNIRMRIRETDGAGNKQGKYSLLPAIPIENLDSSNVELAAQAAAEQAKWENVPEVRLFTFKADYMDSSMSHNTGAANSMAALYESIGLKDAAQAKWPDKTILTNIVGSPVLGFYQPYGSQQIEYIGRYNFDLDKAEHDLFGFTPFVEYNEGTDTVKDSFGYVLEDDGVHLKTDFHATLDEEFDDEKTYYTSPNDNAIWAGTSDTDFQAYVDKKNGTGPLYEKMNVDSIQCWEFLDNGAALCGFRSEWHDGDDLQLWTAAFESRYPEYVTERASDKRAFERFVNWVASTNQNNATGESFGYDENEQPIVKYGYTADTKAYRLAKFKSEINNYMNLSYTLFYYIVTEALVMIDSRGKNMMMCCFDADTTRDTGHWFPIFYDMDTILGLTNTGVLRFRYDTDDAIENGVYNASANYGHYNDQNEWIPNAKVSILWANLREAFQSEISDLYNRLRKAGKFSYDFLATTFNDALADAYAQIYNNKDAKYKFIDPLGQKVIIDGEESEIVANYLHAGQGTRSLHREYFLKHRFAYLDSKYPTYEVGTHDIRLRLYDMDGVRNVPNLVKVTGQPAYYHFDQEGNPKEGITNQQFLLTSSSTQFGVAKVGNGSNMEPVKLEIDKPTWTRVPVGLDTLNEKEAYLFNLGDVYDIGDLSDKFPVEINVMKDLKLRILRIGNTDPTYNTDISLKLSGWNHLPLLETLLLENGKVDVSTPIDLSQCYYLKEVLAHNSNLQSITFPVGGNLTKLELPASLKGLRLISHRYFDSIHTPTNLKFDGYGGLNEVWIEDCPLVDSLTLINNIRLANRSLTYIRLPDLNWTIPATEDWCEFDSQGHIIDIKPLAYLTTVPYGINANGDNIMHSATGNGYIAGRIKIANGENIGVDSLSISRKYAQQFPDLEITFDDNEFNISGYHINIHDLAGSVIASNDRYLNSVVLSADEILGENGETAFDFAQHLSTRVAIPSNNPTTQYTYKFVGWSKVTAYADPIEANVDAILDAVDGSGIRVEIIEDQQTNTTYMRPVLAERTLTLEDFDENLELNLYPVFLNELREYYTWFFMTEEGDPNPRLNPEFHVLDNENGVYVAELNGNYTPKKIKFGTPAQIPDNEPVIITLDPNDKTKALIQKMNHYDEKNGAIPLTRVTANCQYYPIFDTAQLMDGLTDPATSYFDVEDVSGQTINTAIDLVIPANSIKATIKSSYTGEAITIPLEISGKKVVSIANNSATIKRIFFEKDPDTLSSNILYITGGLGAGFCKSIEPQSNVETAPPNTTLEYVEFSACKQLRVIGGQQDGKGETYEFFNCTSLYVPELPDSLAWIGGSVFRADPEVVITKLPRALVYIGQFAFRKCLGIHELDMSDHVPYISVGSYPQMDLGAFAMCTNLTSPGECFFQGWKTIGQQAFQNCINLVAFKAESPGLEPEGTSVVTIGNRAFEGCSKLTVNTLPRTLVSIGNRAFKECGPLVFAMIPSSVSTIQKQAFMGSSIGTYTSNGANVATNGNGNVVNWALPPILKSAYEDNTNVAIQFDPDCLDGLVCAGIRFDNFERDDVYWADYDKDRNPVWQFAIVEPFYDKAGYDAAENPVRTDYERMPFGAKTALGAPTPWTISNYNTPLERDRA